jgi:hypothetical protein
MRQLGDCECPLNEFSEICTGDMPSMDKWYHIILHNQREGETFGQCELRLRSYVLTGEKVKVNIIECIQKSYCEIENPNLKNVP